jgi:hypothetical protein
VVHTESYSQAFEYKRFLDVEAEVADKDEVEDEEDEREQDFGAFKNI